MRTNKELIYVLKMFGMPCHGEEKSVMQEAAEALETLQQELQDERHRHDRYVDFELAQAEELRKLKDQTRWIPVTERLPEESGEYLAYCGEFDGICVVYYEILKTKSKWRTNWKQVTHWMPLPEPPKGE